MNEDNRYIRFDWAIKHMLRDKANFDVLEGLLTVLIGEKIKIEEILESEANHLSDYDKYNLTEFSCLFSNKQRIKVEIQILRELGYRQRIVLNKNIPPSPDILPYNKSTMFSKIYSIVILYFDIGDGDDYIYHGYKTPIGLNTGTILNISDKDKDVIFLQSPNSDIREYYTIHVTKFNHSTESCMAEWTDYLKTNNIYKNTSTPGLIEAVKKLKVSELSNQDRYNYEDYLDAIMFQNDVLECAKEEGRQIGLVKAVQEIYKSKIDEGIEKGKKKAWEEMVEKLRNAGLDDDRIAEIIGQGPEIS